MVINRLTDSTDIDVYFHMRNHYKKLRNVKSVIDSSAPQGFIKSTATPPNSDRSWKTYSFEERPERHPKDCSHLPNHGQTIKKHNCAISNPKSNSARSASTPPRPKTRRHPYEMPFRSQWKSRSQSVGLTSRKDVSTDPINNRVKKKRKAMTNKNNVQEVVECEKIPEREVEVNKDVPSDDTNRTADSRQTSSISNESAVSKSRTEEHEYLQFLLRITEDIIINNFYTSEDVEKVFKNHVEANRDRLKMEKMEAQLNMLCKELHVPCKNSENGVKSEECYSNIFKNGKHISRYTRHHENCECGTKRTLECESTADKKINTMATDDSEENCFQLDKDRFPSSLTVLLNKHSLGRVTECTEPTNSLTTLSSSTKIASLTTVSSFGNVMVLPCFEEDEDSKVSEDSLSKNKEPTEKDIPLTDKEKMGCEEEKFTLDKDTSVTQNEAEFPKICIDKETMSNFAESNFDINCDEKNVFYKNLLDESNIKDAIIQTQLLQQNESIVSFNNTQRENDKIIPTICTNPLEYKEIAPTIQEQEPDDTFKFSVDKETQAEISRCDKECNTEKKLEIYPPIINDDYILINGPVYVLRTVLNTKENIIVGDVSTKETNVKEITPKKESENEENRIDAICSINYNAIPSYLRQSEFSRLLNSDYDLTPQRDENTSEKYHHLLVDAATSITNLGATTISAANLNPDALLLTENYSLANETDKNIVPVHTDSIHVANSENLLCDQENNYMFSTNELSSDGNYEIKSYTMPKEVNGSVGLSGYSVSSHSERDMPLNEATIELDISLTSYEIKSESSNFDKAHSEKGISGEVANLADIVSVNTTEVDEVSQTSSVRSEKSQSSTTSTIYTKHILGKRKLNHPS